jgi:hypothetical protein
LHETRVSFREVASRQPIIQLEGKYFTSPAALIIELLERLSKLASSHAKAVAMLWFKKGKKELWDKDIQWPVGDLEAARKIRDICNSAAGSAERVGDQLRGAGTKANKYETERYQRAAKTAMEIALKITDDLLRDSAVCQIVALCVKASDLRTAVILFRAVQAVSIRQNMLSQHPVLRQSVAS